jgi:hypothetical protein
VQPHSNANAAPFGRTTLTVPGGVPRGHGHAGGPRQRSGPRAHAAKYGKANGNSPGHTYAGHHEHRRDGAFDTFKGPGRGQRPPKRGRADVEGNVAPRREVNANVAPRGEVNGNVAPPGEKPFVPDDDA